MRSPSVGSSDGGEQAHGGGLACAVRAHKTEDLALVDGKSDIARGEDVAETLRQVFGADCIVCAFHFAGGSGRINTKLIIPRRQHSLQEETRYVPNMRVFAVQEVRQRNQGQGLFGMQETRGSVRLSAFANNEDEGEIAD